MRLLGAIMVLCLGTIALSMACERLGYWEPDGTSMIQALASALLFIATVALGITQYRRESRKRR